MKFIIEHSRTKRNIDGPFNIAASRDDLQTLVNCILRELDSEGRNFHYGWIRISKEQEDIVNTEPIGWNDEGNTRTDAYICSGCGKILQIHSKKCHKCHCDGIYEDDLETEYK